MKPEIPVTNPSKTTLYVGGFAVMPGETRILPSDLVPAHLHPQTPVDEPVAPGIDETLGEILKGTVAQVAAALGDLTDDHLALLASFEDAVNGGAGRKGVLAAIADAQLQRASRAHLAEFEASLVGLDEEALLAKLDEVGNDLDKAESVQAALDALNPGGTGDPA